MDYCGRVVGVGENVKNLKEGDLVSGSKFVKGNRIGQGSLAQFMYIEAGQVAVVPEGLGTGIGKEGGVDALAALGCAAVTACQCIVPNMKEGDKLFINGGSGGTGTWGIQIAKALECYVTTNCSTGNVELVKSVGADDVLDYKSVNVAKELEGKGQVFSLVVDNVGVPGTLYRESHKFLVPNGKFVQVGAGISLGAMGQLVQNSLRPGFLGGGKRMFEFLVTQPKKEDLEQLGRWMQEGRFGR
ncbi:hypothetical protein BCR34DRAFT_580435 [Clohesyomyces aquaticus]|uniref:Enoyl reductase (ER) domain-containing protein n=1 Tax=Clohesyomyces aquaticus TaxID=1231657 RepID=A0A1Y1Y6H6_9PLEO|nr:hypothetical protein BCR34DRAFT_580435 [Clohesyomyces aquaticus]